MDVSVVIPCYNEAPLLVQNTNEIKRVLDEAKYKSEFIFVDDCSRDNTRELITELAQQLPHATIVFNEMNVGRGGSFTIGARRAAGKYVGFLDIDLEVSANYLPHVFQTLNNGADVATINRKYSLNFPVVFLLRGLLSKGYKWLARTTLKLPYKDTETGYKFFKKESLDIIINQAQNKHWFWDTEIMALAHLNDLVVEEIDGYFIRKKEKESTVNVISDSLIYIKELWAFRKRLNQMRKEKQSK